MKSLVRDVAQHSKIDEDIRPQPPNKYNHMVALTCDNADFHLYAK